MTQGVNLITEQAAIRLSKESRTWLNMMKYKFGTKNVDETIVKIREIIEAKC